MEIECKTKRIGGSIGVHTKEYYRERRHKAESNHKAGD